MRRNRPFVIFAAVFCLWLGGCSESQLAQVDQAAAAVQDSTDQAGELVSSPIGGLLGPQGQSISLLGISAIGAAAMAWQTWRKGQVQRTLTTVARSIEKAPEQIRDELKSDIKVRMIESGEMALQNKIIDKAKA